MSHEMQELLAQRDSALNALETLKAAGKAGTEEFKNKLAEATQIQNACDQLNAVEELQKRVEVENTGAIVVKNTDKNGFKAIVDYARGIKNAETQLVQGGDHNENYLIPEDVRLEINEAKKQWKSARILCTEIETIGITGSFNFDVEPTKGLVSFADGDDIDASVAPQFSRKTFTITYKGAILPVSQLLLGNERVGLMTYLRNWFVKRAVISENTDIFAAAKANYNSGTPKAIADWKALKKSITVDLDPAIAESADFMLVTNQDGFAALDSALDENGRPILQPNPADPTRKMFYGYQVEVFSNAMLPSVSGKAPVIYGDTKSALYFIYNPDYQFATDGGVGIGFTRNQVLLRVIEGYTVFGADTSGYVYAELPLA